MKFIEKTINKQSIRIRNAIFVHWMTIGKTIETHYVCKCVTLGRNKFHVSFMFAQISMKLTRS